MSDTFREINHRPIHWQSGNGTVHACEGCYVSYPLGRTRLIWTLCERDVPAGKAFLPATPPHGAWQPVNCAACLAKQIQAPDTRGEANPQ